jgi:hypothetical protein
LQGQRCREKQSVPSNKNRMLSEGDKQSGAKKTALVRAMDHCEKKRHVQGNVGLQTNEKLRPTESECRTALITNHPGTGKVSDLQEQSGTT